MRDPARPMIEQPTFELGMLERLPSYEAVARELGVDRAVARRMVRRAVEAAVTGVQAPSSVALRGHIIDYLLGEQTLPQRIQTRSALDRSAAARAWASEARMNLVVLLPSTPPAIPDPVTDIAERRPDRKPAAGSSAQPPPMLAFQGERIDGAMVTTPAEARRRRLVAGGVVLVIFATALVLVLTAAGSKSTPRSARLANAQRGAGRKGAATHVQHLRLISSGPQPHASAVAAVVHQGGSFLLLLQGRGLAPNAGNYYAVWLYNSEGDTELLGLVSPAVGTAGTFASGTTLPDDAFRFHELLVTLETTTRPSRPGRQILSSPLSVQ